MSSSASTPPETVQSLPKIHFDNQGVQRLPIDEEQRNYIRQVEGACFSRVQPTPLENPTLVAVSRPAMALLDFDDESLYGSDDFLQVFCGNKLLSGSDPVAHCYCGHQFGSFAGQLGDGAAISLGEVLNSKGERWEAQLKGAGPTPYSRQADGRKVLRSSIREFLCSEAMHFLGVPTTRAGTIITSDTLVIRDMFYDGRPRQEKASVVLRISPSFLRFGSFEIVRGRDPRTGMSGPSPGRHDISRKLLDFVQELHFKDVCKREESQAQRDLAFFKEVTRRTAKLVAQWQALGWCHGVLNTDNMSILGLTIDYGPFGFMERFDPHFVCNRSDDMGRYEYSAQPSICKWNLGKLAEALQACIDFDEMTAIIESEFDRTFEEEYLKLFRRKLGLQRPASDGSDDERDRDLLNRLLQVMEETAADYTNLFRTLSSVDPDQDSHPLCNISAQLMPLSVLKAANTPRIAASELQKLEQLLRMPGVGDMLGLNQGMLASEVAKHQKMQRLSKMSQQDKTENDVKIWREWILAYQKRLRDDLSKVLAESPDMTREQAKDNRRNLMDSTNPAFVLRNHVAQDAIEKAEQGDFSSVRNILERIQRPFELLPGESLELPPEAAANIAVTCSS